MASPKCVFPLVPTSLCLALVALADDFKTAEGKEYKNATVLCVEPDGIDIKTRSEIAKLDFSESRPEVVERFDFAHSGLGNSRLGRMRKLVSLRNRTSKKIRSVKMEHRRSEHERESNEPFRKG